MRGRGVGRVEAEIDAAAGHAANLLRYALLVGVDRIGRSEFARQLEPFGHQVDRDDPLRPDQPRRDHRTEPDAADTEHRDRIAEPDLERLDHPAGTGHHAAAERAKLLERQVLVHLHGSACGHDRVAGKARLAEEMRVNGFPPTLIGQRGRTIESLAAKAQRHREIAISRSVGTTAGALPARASAEDHVIADRKAAHALTHFLDNARAFMPEHDRLRRMAPGMFVQIGMADAGGDEADAHLARAWLFLFELLERRRVAGAAADGGGDPHAPGFPR